MCACMCACKCANVHVQVPTEAWSRFQILHSWSQGGWDQCDVGAEKKKHSSLLSHPSSTLEPSYCWASFSRTLILPWYNCEDLWSFEIILEIVWPLSSQTVRPAWSVAYILQLQFLSQLCKTRHFLLTTRSIVITNLKKYWQDAHNGHVRQDSAKLCGQFSRTILTLAAKPHVPDGSAAVWRNLKQHCLWAPALHSRPICTFCSNPNTHSWIHLSNIPKLFPNWFLEIPFPSLTLNF